MPPCSPFFLVAAPFRVVNPAGDALNYVLHNWAYQTVCPTQNLMPPSCKQWNHTSSCETPTKSLTSVPCGRPGLNKRRFSPGRGPQFLLPVVLAAPLRMVQAPKRVPGFSRGTELRVSTPPDDPGLRGPGLRGLQSGQQREEPRRPGRGPLGRESLQLDA